ncbi:hypothetical protein DFH09DRAFT_1312960 [Mycena vulgaris]|nr:hypothetical protein DFH09DRAFT_1312960 [Mycena vulgaris]
MPALPAFPCTAEARTPLLILPVVSEPPSVGVISSVFSRPVPRSARALGGGAAHVVETGVKENARRAESAGGEAGGGRMAERTSFSCAQSWCRCISDTGGRKTREEVGERGGEEEEEQRTPLVHL